MKQETHTEREDPCVKYINSGVSKNEGRCPE